MAALFFTAAAAFAQEKAGGQKPATNVLVKPGLTNGKPAGNNNILAEDQIAELLTEWTDEKTGARLVFNSSFGVRTVSPQEKRKYVKSGKIPVRITCSLEEVKEVNGKQLAKRVSGGSARFYIMDADGKVIEKKSVALDKMCPS